MKLDSLKYGKVDGNKDERVVKKQAEKKTAPTTRPTPLPKTELPSDYTKPEGKIDVRILFILSGGEDRERNYFKMLKDDQKLERIKVAFASKKGQGLNPTQLLEVAKMTIGTKRFIAEDTSFRFEEANGDIIYLLQDIDEFELEIRRLETEKQHDCLRWIYSNPAFEMWLYYHHFSNPLPELKDAVGKTPAERSRWLKNYLPEIIKGGVKTTKAIAQMRTAIENSKANYKEERNLPCLFSTGMHVLAEDILDTMGNEFDQMLERKAAFNKAMREKFKKPIVKGVRYDGVKIRELIADFTEWANNHPLMLPHTHSINTNGAYFFDNRAFPLSYKFEKAVLNDDSGVSMPINMDALFMEDIQNEIYHFYQVLFIQNSPIVSYTIDFSQIKNVIDMMGLDNRYAILSSFHLNTYDTLYGGEPLQETGWGYTYKDVPIYKTPARGRFMIIMRKEYLPKADFKQYEGENTEFEQIDGKNLIYSNIHKMKDLGEHYGLSVMRVVKFQLPQKGSFRFIKLNIVDYAKEKSEFNKMSKADTVNLQYQEGDFVTYHDQVHEILSISKGGEITLSYKGETVYLNEIAPVKIDGIHDANIYYDPIVAAFTVAPDEPIPSVTVNEQYYMESFKNDLLEEGGTLFEKVANCHFSYVHELQHWLLETQGQSGLKLKWHIE